MDLERRLLPPCMSTAFFWVIISALAVEPTSMRSYRPQPAVLPSRRGVFTHFHLPY